MAFKILTDDELDKLSIDEHVAYSEALTEHLKRFPLVRTTTKFMRLRNPETGQTLNYKYRIAEYADGTVFDNHDFRRDGCINILVRQQMATEGKIRPADLGDGETHSVLTAAVPSNLEAEYCQRCDALFAQFSIDEPAGRPDIVREYKKTECK